MKRSFREPKNRYKNGAKNARQKIATLKSAQSLENKGKVLHQRGELLQGGRVVAHLLIEHSAADAIMDGVICLLIRIHTIAAHYIITLLGIGEQHRIGLFEGVLRLGFTAPHQDGQNQHRGKNSFHDSMNLRCSTPPLTQETYHKQSGSVYAFLGYTDPLQVVRYDRSPHRQAVRETTPRRSRSATQTS